ncbi:MAG: alanine racemase, partial [Desulfobacterales bacterium]
MTCFLKLEHTWPELLSPQTMVRVDIDAISRNIRALQGLTAPGIKFMAVVKANAYGHGAVGVAKTALKSGADMLAVARISEAVELRNAGIEAPILLFGDVLPAQAPYLAEHDIRATVTCLDMGYALAAALDSSEKHLNIHIKVDTGMGRLGFVHTGLNPHQYPPENAIDDILTLGTLPKLSVEGIYTHLSKADEQDKTHARKQINRFLKLTDRLRDRGFDPGIRHIANSATVIDLIEAHLDMIRPGIAIYGLWPSNEVDTTRLTLEPAMSIHTKVIQLKSVPAGFGVSYGGTHVTQAPTIIATVPVGYADGFSRLLSNQGHMLVKGTQAPIL